MNFFENEKILVSFDNVIVIKKSRPELVDFYIEIMVHRDYWVKLSKGEAYKFLNLYRTYNEELGLKRTQI